MESIAKSAVDKIDVFLRTVAPGFVCLFVLAVASPDDPGQPIRTLQSGESWKMVAVGVGIGFAAYALHLAALEDVFLSPVIWGAKELFSDAVPDEFAGKSRTQITRRLAEERWARPASDEKKVVSYHNRLLFNYSWLIFIYCTGYGLIGAAFFANAHGYEQGRVCTMVVCGVAVLLLGMWNDVKVTGFEMWLVKRYPQISKAASP